MKERSKDVVDAYFHVDFRASAARAAINVENCTWPDNL